ncbi:MAG: 2-amino-4-hydroxy-6-hydroxymethyldihydropteridine diphosphokinase [Alphaproteobacteria bacterium]
MTVPVYIALGSNLGDRAAQIDAAVERLSAIATIEKRSRVYETAPKYVTDQPAFLNMAVLARTGLAPLALLAATQSIEKALGRIPGQRFGPRAIDLDILFYGDEAIDLPELTVPHPRIAERRFVLQPLNDIAAKFRHPATGQSVSDMLAALPPDKDVRLFAPSDQN